MDPLTALRASIKQNAAIKLLTTTSIDTADVAESIVQASALLFPKLSSVTAQDTAVPLDQLTRFIPTGEDQPVDLRTIYNCFLTKDLNVTDYIAISEERNIKNLKFLDRANLLTWLDGATDSISNLEEAEKPDSAVVAKSESTSASTAKSVDPHLEEIYANERVLVDQNKQLHGAKNIDFSFAAALCKKEVITPLKATLSSKARHHPSATTSSTGSSSASAFQKKGKDPIILVSPSASSALNIANIKQFLEQGSYEAVASTSGSSNIIRLSRQSPRLGTSSVRFIVVDSVDKFKPEYWDRVVAVFVTGQQWQLSPYKWPDPNTLFQKVLGFGVVFRGDNIPPTLQNWNVAIEVLDRNHRFRDREVVERIWDRIESYMLARGWQVR